MSLTVEVESQVTASRFFKALLKWHELAPKATPEIVSSAQLITLNETGVGSVRQFNFTPVMPFEYLKERLDFVHLEKLESKQSLIEGGELGKKLESATREYKFTPSSTGGCVVKIVMTYKVLPGVNVSDEEEKAKGSVTAFVKAAEAYLLANPDACA